VSGVHRYAVFAMADGPEAAPACEADTETGALMAVAAQANEGAPGWYVVVDRQTGQATQPAQRVRVYHAPEGVTVAGLWPLSAWRPWMDAARDAKVDA
jgi:hypothetical protein